MTAASFATADGVRNSLPSFTRGRSALTQPALSSREPSAGRERSASVTDFSRVEAFSHDFEKLRVHADGEFAQIQGPENAGILSFQSPAPSSGRNSGSGGGATGATPAASPKPSVDKIDVINTTAGAIGGYPAITSGDLNQPGPFNNAATGAVNNVHQFHFHLDKGSSADLTPTRIVRGSNWLAGVELKHPADQVLPPGVAGPPAPGGFGGVMDAPDGPAAHEIQRPSTDKIVVADAPGISRLAAANYPYSHNSTFKLTVAAPDGSAVARIEYGVRIQKKNATDIPNTENRVFAISKEDLVRGRSL